MSNRAWLEAVLRRMQAITRPWNYAIVDEVDSVLIDECRNPMIMSLASEDESVERYQVAAQVSTPGNCAPHAAL